MFVKGLIHQATVAIFFLGFSASVLASSAANSNNPQATQVTTTAVKPLTSQSNVEAPSELVKPELGESQVSKSPLTPAGHIQTQAAEYKSSPEVGRHVSSGISLLNMLSSLFIVIVVIVISAWLLKRFQSTQKLTGGLKLVSSLNIGTKERLLVVQAGDKQLLLGATPHSINLITELEQPLESSSIDVVSEQISPFTNSAFYQLIKNKWLKSRQNQLSPDSIEKT